MVDQGPKRAKEGAAGGAAPGPGTVGLNVAGDWPYMGTLAGGLGKGVYVAGDWPYMGGGAKEGADAGAHAGPGVHAFEGGGP